MTIVVCVSSLLVFSGAATAAPFQVYAFEAGGGLPGIIGQGFTVSAGGFFTAEGAGDNIFGGAAAAMTDANEFEFDSHFALDGFGPSARNRTERPADNSFATTNFYGDYGAPGEHAASYDELEGTQNALGPFNAAGTTYLSTNDSHVGDPQIPGRITPENQARGAVATVRTVGGMRMSSPVSSHFAPNAPGGRSTNDGVFIGRLTIQRGAQLSGGIYLGTSIAPNEAPGAELRLNGPAGLFQTSGGPQMLVFRSYLVVGLTLVNRSAATSDGIDGGNAFGRADVYDLWVQVPPPGVPVLLALAGIGAVRRRRS